jgi:adenosylhomocysteine nucleosidase
LSRFATDVALTEDWLRGQIARVHRGLIASGDQFIGKLAQIQA